MDRPAPDRLRLEFTVEPFIDGGPGAHVLAAIDVVRRAGLTPDDGPFGTAVEADADAIHRLLSEVPAAALASGATGVSLSVHPVVAVPVDAQPVLDALRPIVSALGGVVVAADRMRPTDLAFVWNGQTVAGVRPPVSGGTDLQDVLPAMIGEVEASLGAKLGAMSRTDKQRAARLLAERGVFQLRNAVDDVADAMGVSRATIYNYLQAARGDG
jgi:uncharacterized protein YqgV (UPF0045/DUF77 family)